MKMHPLFRKLLHRIADYGYPDITIIYGKHQTTAIVRCPWSQQTLRLTSDVDRDDVDVMNWSDAEDFEPRTVNSGDLGGWSLDSIYSHAVRLQYPHNGTDYILDELSQTLGPNPDRCAAAIT